MARNELVSTVLLALLVVALSGCGKKEPTANKAAGNTNRSTFTSPASDFAGEITALTANARQSEENFEFDLAVKRWEQIRQKIVAQLGQDSWQARNAGYALESARAKSQFSAEQRQQLQRLRQINDQVKQSFQDKQFSQALGQSVQLYNLQAQLTGKESIEVGQLAIQIATLQSQLGQIDSAIHHFHQGIEILRLRGYGDHPELQLAHAGLAAAYARKGQLAPAVANQKHATRIAGVIEGMQSTEYATQANQLGVLYHQAGNLQVAHDILHATKAIRGRALGQRSTAFGHSCLNLGIVALDQKQLDEAEENFTVAEQIFAAEFGAGNSLSSRCNSHLATIQMLRNRPDLAERFLRDVVDDFTEGESSDPEGLLAHRYRLAIALARQGKYEEAGPLLVAVIDQQRQRFGESDARTMKSLKAYVLLLESSHQYDAAKAVRQQINRVAKSVSGNEFQPLY